MHKALMWKEWREHRVTLAGLGLIKNHPAFNLNLLAFTLTLTNGIVATFSAVRYGFQIQLLARTNRPPLQSSG